MKAGTKPQTLRVDENPEQFQFPEHTSKRQVNQSCRRQAAFFVALERRSIRSRRIMTRS